MTPTSESTSPVDKSRALTARTLEKIDELKLRSTPEFYELWYRYFDGDPEILRAIDTYEGGFDEIACQKIYNRYLSNGAHDAALDKAGEQVQKSVTVLGATLESARAAAVEYGGALGAAEKKISQAKDMQALGETVSGLLQETRAMAQKSLELEEELKVSAKQVADMKVQLDSARREATTDSLTGIANRKTFDRRISDDIVEAVSAHTPLVMLMLDIDHFKKFTDAHGAQTADQVLRLAAHTLLGNVKGRDTAARYGIDEFAILLPNTSLKSGIQVAEILRKTMESKEITDKSSGTSMGSITLSIGVAKYREDEDTAAFIGRAESALKEAKAGGRNRVRVAVENKASPRVAEQ